MAAPVAPSSIAPKTPQVIEVGDQGFTPADLIAVRGFEIIWKNTSQSPRAIRFDNYSTTDQPIESAPIPPGGSWTWCPSRGASIVYSSSSIPGARGHFQVEEELEPGQSPFSRAALRRSLVDCSSAPRPLHPRRVNLRA